MWLRQISFLVTFGFSTDQRQRIEESGQCSQNAAYWETNCRENFARGRSGVCTQAPQGLFGRGSNLSVFPASYLSYKYIKLNFLLGENYPETEQQPRDDLAILAASAMVSAYTGSGESRAKSKGCRTYPSDAGKASYLTQAIVILEFALSKSPYNARFRILLTRLYRLIGKYLCPFSTHD
jgi:hypothetical protein